MSLPEHISACPNCGFEPFNSAFCPECGQKKLTEKDFKVGALVGDFVSGILSLENTLLTTLKGFLSNPSAYLKQYNAGARKKFIAPVKWFLLANAFYFLFPVVNTFTTTLDTQINKLFYSPLTKNLILTVIELSDWEFSLFESEYNSLTQTLSKVLLFVLPVLFGVFTKSISFKQKKSLVEHVNYSFVLHAFILLFITSIIPGAFLMTAKVLQSEGMFNLLTETNLTLMSIILINGYGFFLYRKFFHSKWWLNGIRWLSLNLIFIALVYFYRFFLLLATLSWMWMFRF